MTFLPGWLADGALLLVLLALLAYVWREQRGRLQKMEEDLARAEVHLDSLRVSVARIEAQIESTLKENNASRAAVRRVEDYLLQAKRRSHDPDTNF